MSKSRWLSTRRAAGAIVSLDMKACGLKSPGYHGYMGPQFQARPDTNNAKPHRTLIGRKTYDVMNSVPDHQTARVLVLKNAATVRLAGLKLVRGDVVDFVRDLKRDSGPELRVLGRLSVMRPARCSQSPRYPTPHGLPACGAGDWR